MTWAATKERVRDHTDRVLDALRAKWGETASAPTITLGPNPWHPDEPPASLDDQLAVFGGVASAVVFYTDAREETVLVYNRGGYWEPPGGVVEPGQTPADAARAETREETGLAVELDDLLYATRVRLRYGDGSEAELPAATFVARRRAGTLSVERESNDHPGVTRGVGLFGADVLPESTRDRERIRRCLLD